MKSGTYLPLKKCKSGDKKSVEHLQGIFTTSHRTKASGGCFWVVQRGQKKECGDEIIVSYTQGFWISKKRW